MAERPASLTRHYCHLPAELHGARHVDDHHEPAVACRRGMPAIRPKALARTAPRCDILAPYLFAAAHGSSPPSCAPELRRAAGDAGPVIDAQAATSYRERVRALRAELEQAGARHDIGRVEAIRAEIESIEHELAYGIGRHGFRRVGSYLLDLTPATDEFVDAPLPVGQTFADAANGITVRTLAVSPEGVTVEVHVPSIGGVAA